MNEPSAARRRMLAGLSGVERRVDVGGVATSVFEVGDGAPLVLLHGGIESGGAYWTPVIAQLAERHRVIVPDAPGIGESAPVEQFDFPIFTSWFNELLRVIGAKEPRLVAHSLLGSYSARYASLTENNLTQLVIYAAPGVGPYKMPLRLKYVAVRFAIRPTPRNSERFDRFLLLNLDATRSRDREWFEAFETYNLDRASVPHVQRTMRQLISAGTKQIPDVELQKITCPVAMLWGSEDRMVPVSIADGAKTRLGWPLHTIAGAAHAPHLEQPQAFLSTLATILNSG